MSMNYRKLAQKPCIFRKLSGVSLVEFEAICCGVQPLWAAQVDAKRRSPAGRKSCFTCLEDKVLALMMYYRTYITHEFIGYLFGIHNANVCRLFKRLEPMMAKTFAIKKDRSLTADAVLRLLADVTEQPIQRPQKAKRRKANYSGKKKRHTQKVELVMTEAGKICTLSASYPGRQHDFRIRQAEKPLPRAAETWVDLGYQGLQRLTQQVRLPFKRKPKQVLTAEQKAYNRQHAAFRIRIEHKIRELKIFRILSEVYRNFGKKHHLRMNIIAGILNLRHGF